MLFNSSQYSHSSLQWHRTMNISKCHSLIVYFPLPAHQCKHSLREVLVSSLGALHCPFSTAATPKPEGPRQVLGSLNSCGKGVSVYNLFQEKAELNQVESVPKLGSFFFWLLFSVACLRIMGRDFPRSEVSLLPWENLVNTLSSALQTLTN